MATPMTDQERREFLMTGTRTGKVATVRKDGRPHVAPIWFVLDGDDIVFTTGTDSLKGKSLQRDGRISMTVDDETPPFAFVVIDGTVELSEDLDELLKWATTIGGRYMGDHVAEHFGNRNAVVGELLVRIKPTKIVAMRGISD